MTLSYTQITVKAVGDIMLGSITPKEVLPPENGTVFAETMRQYLTGSDIILGNLEGSFRTDSLKPVKCSDSAIAAGKCYEFGMPENLAGSLKQMGFNLLSLHNNHSQDFGKEGYLLTQRILDSLGIKFMPKEGFTIIHAGEITIAAAAFGFSGLSNNIFDLKKVREIIASLKKKFRIVIIYFHGGAEGKDAAHVRNTEEYYLEEDRGNVVKFAKAAVDAGADLVIGSGPHVLRTIEIYKDKLIAYSLGNFLTYGNVNITGISGIAAILKIVLNKDNGNFMFGSVIPTVQRGRGIPRYDKYGRAVRIIRYLLSEDMMLNSAVIENDGKIIKSTIIDPGTLTIIRKSGNENRLKYSMKKISLPTSPAVSK